MPSTPRIVVAGGSGFVGSRICKAAVHRGWAVTSLSRSGEPHWPSLFKLHKPPDWASQVEWHKANIFHPYQYADKLENASAVVHSMGLLLEANYKVILSGKEPIISSLKKAFSSAKGQARSSESRQSSNPLEKIPLEDEPPLLSKDEELNSTCAHMNRDSALILAHESIRHHVPAFAYISAADGFPLLPSNYIQTKRQAEDSLLQMAGFRTIIVRPAFIYDSTRVISIPLAAATGITSAINSLFGRALPLLGAAGYKPLKADTIAEAVVEAIADEDSAGIIDVDNIEKLATKAWRRQML